MTPARVVITSIAIVLYLCVFSVAASAQSGPAIQSITPDAVPAGGPDTFITVKGSGFNPSSVIMMNDFATSLPTTFITSVYNTTHLWRLTGRILVMRSKVRIASVGFSTSAKAVR